MPTNYITLPRSKLYELVWSKPVRDVAAEFGISDVALAKRCRAIKIPLPPRGYWARVAAGQKPRRPPLPPFSERKRTALPSYVTSPNVEGSGGDGLPEIRSQTVTRQGQPSASSQGGAPGVSGEECSGRRAPEPSLIFDPERTAHKHAIEEPALPAVTVAPTADLTTELPIVKRTARHYKHPHRSELTLPAGQKSGPILRLDVSPDALDRALLFADTFLRAAAEQGWSPIPPKEPDPPDSRHYYGRPPEPKPHRSPHYADLDVDGHRIEFRIEERFELRELPPTEKDLARQKRDSWFRPQKRHEKIWSGRLRFKRPGHRYPYGVDGKSWFETANRKLVDTIPRILADLRAVATRMQEVDEENERQERERERQAKLAAELSERRAANAELIHTLEAEAGAWARAQFLRRYLRAARRALGAHTLTTDLQGQSIDFLDWADRYVAACERRALAGSESGHGRPSEIDEDAPS